MVKEKRILSYILGWLILGYIICFIGINNVFAATFDNFEVTWYYRNKSNESQLLNVLKQEDVPLYASTNEYVNGYTTRVEQTFNKQIQYIVNYQLQMWFSPEQELNYRSDTIQRIIDYSYVDSDFKILNTEAKENWNRSSGSGDTVLTINVSMQVLALNNTNAIRFGVYTTDNISIGFYNHTDQIDYYLVNNVSIEENANAVIIDQNNQIINGQNNLQNSITNSENNIINNQNQNTEDMIQSQVACSFIDKTNIKTNNYYLNGSGVEVSGNNFGITDYINVLGGKLKLLQVDEYNAYACFYNVNKELISCTATNSLALGEMTIPTNANYARFTINKSTNKPTFELCRNGNQAIVDSQNQMNDKLNGIQGALTDSSAPNTGALENSAGWLPAGPLDSVLNLPLTMINSLTNSLGKTCTPLNLTLPYVNKNIQIPCLSAIFAQITGVNGLWTWVGTIASVLILYNYLLNLYAWVDRVLTLRAEFDEAMGADLANWGRL